jgi:hypothetical protein
MARYTEKQYRKHMFSVMAIYVGLMLLEWPHVRSATSLPWKILLALAPVIPIVVVIWLMARRITHSDELEQRLHLMALSVASAMICTLTLMGGFLCAAGVLALDGDILIWIAPTLSLIYGATHVWLGRRYGNAGCA